MAYQDKIPKSTDDRPMFDKILDSFISKKLTVFGVACLFVFLGKIGGEQWVNVAMVYIGSQAAVDAASKLISSGRKL